MTDRNTQERKGIAYIKFEKASEAHTAMEKLHGETVGGDSKPLKVSMMPITHDLIMVQWTRRDLWHAMADQNIQLLLSMCVHTALNISHLALCD